MSDILTIWRFLDRWHHSPRNPIIIVVADALVVMSPCLYRVGVTHGSYEEQDQGPGSKEADA